ncbi:MAG: hypothetical protein JXR70_08230 [Spirochaetales bacterium]|nr:hypothetical protein [Spirochaetales bacterium]
MNRKDLKEIITSVIEKMQENTPATACGAFFADNPIITTYYAVGEEDSTPTPEITGEPATPTPIETPTPRPTKDPVITTYYAVGEEDAL